MQYGKEPFDFKRFFLLNGKRFWIVLVGAVIGCVLCLLACYLKNVAFYGDTKYQSSYYYYISFDTEDIDTTHLYYNDYTWNEVLDSDPVAGRAAELLGDMTKSEVAEVTHIPTMSDMRYFWVDVTVTNREKAEVIQKAISQALSEFGQNQEGFLSISVFDRQETLEVPKTGNYKGYGISGAILGLVAGTLLLWYLSAVDDGFYTEKDVIDRLGLTVYGVRFQTEETLPGFEEKKTEERLLLVPFGIQGSTKYEHEVMAAKAEGKPYGGAVITGADIQFYKKYYGV